MLGVSQRSYAYAMSPSNPRDSKLSIAPSNRISEAPRLEMSGGRKFPAPKVTSGQRVSWSTSSIII